MVPGKLGVSAVGRLWALVFAVFSEWGVFGSVRKIPGELTRAFSKGFFFADGRRLAVRTSGESEMR